MVNPLYGILINGQYYQYDISSYKRGYGIKNSIRDTQTSRTASVQGGAPYTHTMTLILANTYNVVFGTSLVGTTSWLGSSRVSYLKSIIGGLGPSMPLTLIAPDGTTHLTIPVGEVQEEFFYENPPAAGFEYRVSLTLDNTQ